MTLLFFRQMNIMPGIQTRANDDEMKKNMKTRTSIGVGRLKLFNTNNSLYASACGQNRQTFTLIKQKKDRSPSLPLGVIVIDGHRRLFRFFPLFSSSEKWFRDRREKKKKLEGHSGAIIIVVVGQRSSGKVDKSRLPLFPHTVTELWSRGTLFILFRFLFLFFTRRLHVDCLRSEN